MQISEGMLTEVKSILSDRIIRMKCWNAEWKASFPGALEIHTNSLGVELLIPYLWSYYEHVSEQKLVHLYFDKDQSLNPAQLSKLTSPAILLFSCCFFILQTLMEGSKNMKSAP